MKYDRIQETFRFITPGIYLLALILWVNFDIISGDVSLKETISKFSTIIVVLLPFVGFVFGYFIECMMTLVERFMYWIHIPRPSKVVLNGKCNAYVLDDSVREVVMKGGGMIDDKDANRLRQVAKQAVGGNELVEKYYYQSIMARHILGAQIVASVYYLAFADGWSWSHLIWASTIIAVLAYFWYHQTCVYMKYLFAEYVKLLKADEK